MHPNPFTTLLIMSLLIEHFLYSGAICEICADTATVSDGGPGYRRRATLGVNIYKY